MAATAPEPPRGGGVASPEIAPLFDRRALAWPAVRLGLLSLAYAATEGIGLLMLVPMLDLMGASGRDHSGLGAVLGQRIALGPAPLLGLFVALVVTRAAVGMQRDLCALRFETRIVDGLRRRAWSALLACEWRKLAEMASPAPPAC